MSNLVEVLNGMLSDVITALPAIIAAIIVVIIGYFVGKFVGNAVNKLIEKIGMEKSFDETDTGKNEAWFDHPRWVSRNRQEKSDRYTD